MMVVGPVWFMVLLWLSGLLLGIGIGEAIALVAIGQEKKG